MNFGQALEGLKEGKHIARNGWNGRGMFVYLVHGKRIKAESEQLRHIADEEGTVLHNPYMAIKNVNGTVSTWVPSINDCLAEDWYIVE